MTEPADLEAEERWLVHTSVRDIVVPIPATAVGPIRDAAARTLADMGHEGWVGTGAEPINETARRSGREW